MTPPRTNPSQTFAQLEVGCNKSARRMDNRDDGTPGREWNTHGCLDGITQNCSVRTTKDANANTPLQTINNRQPNTITTDAQRQETTVDVSRFMQHVGTRIPPPWTALESSDIWSRPQQRRNTRAQCNELHGMRTKDSTTTASSSDSIFKGITPHYETDTCHCKTTACCTTTGVPNSAERPKH